jgi:hypothetical protein
MALGLFEKHSMGQHPCSSGSIKRLPCSYAGHPD